MVLMGERPCEVNFFLQSGGKVRDDNAIISSPLIDLISLNHFHPRGRLQLANTTLCVKKYASSSSDYASDLTLNLSSSW